MKLVFIKDAEHQVTVQQEIEGQKKGFSYVDMIKSLLDKGPLELPELEGDFSEPEQKSINRMVGFINKAIKEEEDKDESEDELVSDEYDEGEGIDDDEGDEDMF